MLIQQPKDSINYKQISQNTSININYLLLSSKEYTQNINFNYSLNDMVNSENGIVRKGGISRFHNATVNHSLGIPEKKLNIASSFNFTHTYAGSRASIIWGPSITINKSFLKENKLNTNAGISYNQSNSAESKLSVLNIMLGAQYSPWKHHNFMMNYIHMFRNTNQKIDTPKHKELTATVGYNNLNSINKT